MVGKRLNAKGWSNVQVIGSCLSGIIILAMFVFVERRARWPLLDLALFRNVPFVTGCLSFFLFSAALFGSQPFWSLFMQNTWGLSPLQGGLAFLPATGLIALFTPMFISIFPRLDSGVLIVVAGSHHRPLVSRHRYREGCDSVGHSRGHSQPQTCRE